MTKKHKALTFLVLMTLTITTVGVTGVAARPNAVGACGGGSVSGNVVGVDEATGSVTIDTGGGALCTVTLNGTYNQPIVNLLSKYFGEINASKFAVALAATAGYAVWNPDDGTWGWADASTVGAQQIKVIAFNLDGTFTAQVLDANGVVVETITLTVNDALLAEILQKSLASLAVNFSLDGFGDVLQVSDQIAAYHSQGMGFGVLVKLFSLAQGSGGAVTVEQLVAQFNAGTGIGELFKTYGKPAMLGVGHVRKQVKEQSSSEGKQKEKTEKSRGKKK